MDPVVIAVYRDMVERFGCSAEDILHDPDLRTNFLTECRQSLSGDRPERELLSRLSNLRKRSKLPRSRDIAAATAGVD
jgi:hypothetical protein